MKNFLLVCLMLISLSGLAQDKITITIAGVEPEVEKQFFDHDVIMSWRGYNNITIRAKNKGKNGWALSGSRIYNVEYDATAKHYYMSIACDIKASQWLDINQPMIVRLIAHTSFGNKIWWEQEVTRDIDGQSILLNHYTRTEGSTDKAPVKGIYVHTKKLSSAVSTQANELGGDKPASANNIIFMARNEGQTEWPVQRTLTRYFSDRGSINYAFETGDQIDFSKKIEYGFAALTQKGNYYWVTTTNTSDKIYLPIEIDQYSGKAFDVAAALNTGGAVSTATITTSEKAIEEKVAEVTEKPAPPVVKKDPYTSLSVHVGKLKIANKPDSVVQGNLKSTLEEDGSIKVGSALSAQEIKLKGGQPINYNPGGGYVIEATANGDQTYETKNGEIVLKDGAPMQLSKFYIKAAILASDASLKVEGSDLPVKALGKPGKFDVFFDDSGRLKEATLAKEMSYTLGGRSFSFEDGCKVKLYNGSFSEIGLVNDRALDLSGTNYQVMGNNGISSSLFFDYKSGMIEKVVLTADNSVEIEGAPVPVKGGSWMTFNNDGGTYTIDQFHIGQEMTLNVYKRNKVKPKKVKRGKRVTVENGKVTKVSMF